MNILFRLLNKLPKIPGWCSRLHRSDFEDSDDENYDQIIFTSNEAANLYVKKVWGDSPCYSGGRGLPLKDRNGEVEKRLTEPRSDVGPYEDVLYLYQGKQILFTDLGVFEISPVTGELVFELTFREYGNVIRFIKSKGMPAPPQLPSEKVVGKWMDLLENTQQERLSKFTAVREYDSFTSLIESAWFCQKKNRPEIELRCISQLIKELQDYENDLLQVANPD